MAEKHKDGGSQEPAVESLISGEKSSPTIPGAVTTQSGEGGAPALPQTPPPPLVYNPDYSEAVKPFIEACGRASSRSRYILIAIIFTSVAIFSGAWNQRDASWFESTNQVRKHELEYLAALKDQQTTKTELEDCSSINRAATTLLQSSENITIGTPYGGGLASSLSIRHCGTLTSAIVNQTLQECETAKAKKSGSKSASCNAVLQMQLQADAKKEEAIRNSDRLDTLLKSPDLARGKAFVERGHIVLTDGEYTALLQSEARSDFEQAQHQRYEEEILIKLPLFGTLFHVNDLGILGGFAIAVLMLWMRTAIQEEVNGLQIARQQTEDFSESMDEKPRANFRKRVYYLLSTQQFFFPPRLTAADSSLVTVSRFIEDNSLRLVLLFLTLLPLLIELGLFIEDCGSGEDVQGDNPVGFSLTLHVSLFFLIINSFLLVFTIVSGVRLVKAWEDLAEDWDVDASS